MTVVTASYILIEDVGFGINPALGTLLGVVAGVAAALGFGRIVLAALSPNRLLDVFFCSGYREQWSDRTCMAGLRCALAEPMNSHARRFIAYLLLAVFSAATVPGVGLHCLFELSLPHGDGLSHCSAACAHVDPGHSDPGTVILGTVKRNSRCV